MQTLRFKTSLKCNGCVDAIKPGMESIKGIKVWRVFLDVQEKTLEADLEENNSEEIADSIKQIVSKAGYTVERI